LLDSAEKVKKLAERLSQCPDVHRIDAAEAGTLANAFADLEEESVRFLDETLPRLTRDGLRDEEITDVLHDIGDQFRHILYHIQDPSYYEYLQESGTG